MQHTAHTPLDEGARIRVLASYGAHGDVLQELLVYNQNAFVRLPEFEGMPYPLVDEPFASAWDGYIQQSHTAGALSTLKTCLRHLNFPVQTGISQDLLYRGVVMRGEPVQACPLATGLVVQDPEGIQLRMQSTIAGRIPVVTVANRSDFEQMLQALLNRNEPMPIPPSMGAVMVAGYNNWDRIEQYKHRWQQSAPAHEWADEFKRLIPQKSQYQDRFIVVSSGPYSNTPAIDLNLDEEAWQCLSVEIRTVHECTHYAMKRIYGVMRDNLQDEIIADTMGLVRATGSFRSDWFLRFMGLENHPVRRPDGRLGVYRGNPPLSDAAFAILQTMLVQASANMEALFPPGTDVQMASTYTMEHLATATLEVLSGEKSP